LLAPATRKTSGHRVYGAEAQEVLKLIRHCRDFGFSIDDTRALVSLAASDDSNCAQAREIAQIHLDAVRAKLAELQVLQVSLTKFVKACEEQCIGGPAPKCTILKDLGMAQPAVTVPGRCCG
jgi:DNA-binding transcriptional MerR regulator